MIFPKKHINLSESIFGLSHILLKILKENSCKVSLDELWEKFEKINNTDKFQAYHSFDNFILAINLLYSLGIIKNKREIIEI
jgi:hypothetical protein